ncbi:MAG: A24 family peptidase [Candidatus Acidiferrales bacterium]
MHSIGIQLVWGITLVFAAGAALLDGRTRRIPNWLTVSGFLAGMLVHAALGGWLGLLIALEGAGLGLAILLPLVFLRALGAGDWKLIGALGALVGPQMLWFVLFASVLVAGLMALFLIVRARRVRETIHNVGLIIMGLFTLTAHPEISLDNPGLLKLPFGVAAALGTLLCFVAAHWHLGI